MIDNLKITYKKVENVSLTRSGYTNIEEVSQRHAGALKDKKNYRENITSAVRDFEYFFNIECSSYINSIKEPIKLLDVGCGNGEYSYFFKNLINKKVDYSGCEISDSMVRVCKKTSPRSRFFKSFADNINSDDDKYDILFCSGALQYTIDRWKESLVEMKRVSNKYIALLRLPVVKYHRTCYVEQNMTSEGYVEKNYFVLLNRKELESLFNRTKLKILKRDYSSEEYKIEGIDEKVILVEYFLAKR